MVSIALWAASMTKPAVSAGSDRVLFVLATVARHGEPASIAELVALTALPLSTLYRQIALLKRWGFVTETHGRYGLGPICMQMAHGFDQTSYLIKQAQAEMQRLASSSGETVGLLVAARGQVVCIDMIESRHPLRCSFVKGAGIPLQRGASARSLLAFMPVVQLRSELDRLMLDSDDLERDLHTVRTAGYAVSDSEVDAGVWGVSAPVFLRDKVAAGSITLMAPSSRAASRQSEFVALTMDAARRISTRLSTTGER